MELPITVVVSKVYQIVYDDRLGRFVFQEASHYAVVVAAYGNKAVETE